MLSRKAIFHLFMAEQYYIVGCVCVWFWLYYDDQNRPGLYPCKHMFSWERQVVRESNQLMIVRHLIQLQTSRYLKQTHALDTSGNRERVTGRERCFQLLDPNIIASAPLVLLSRLTLRQTTGTVPASPQSFLFFAVPILSARATSTPVLCPSQASQCE